jgi:hypothetical protein
LAPLLIPAASSAISDALLFTSSTENAHKNFFEKKKTNKTINKQNKKK